MAADQPELRVHDVEHLRPHQRAHPDHGAADAGPLFDAGGAAEGGGLQTSAVVGNVNLAGVQLRPGLRDLSRALAGKDDDRRSELTTRNGLDLLDKASQDGRPFFLWLHYFDPHARYQPPKPFDGMFVNDAHFDARWRVPLLSQKRWDIGGISSNVNLGREDRVAYYVAQYNAEIRSVDGRVGTDAGLEGSRARR